MKLLVTSSAFDSETFTPPHPCGQGLFWDTAGLYLYSLLCDPYVLAQVGALPVLRQFGDEVEDSRDVILFHAAATPELEVPAFESVLDLGGRVVLNHPGPDLPCVRNLLYSVGPQVLMSLRERWTLNPTSSRDYYYADRQPFLRLDEEKGRVLSRIGDNPDLLLTEFGAVFAGNPFESVLSYINTPQFTDLLFDFSTLLVRLVLDLKGSQHDRFSAAELSSNRELRKDFQSFGYAFLTVSELGRCYGRENLDLREAESLAFQGAGALVQGNAGQAEQILRSAFQALEKVQRELQPVSATLIDTLHGGGLFDDIGYFEFEWPQHAADVLRRYLPLCENRSYRFNIDFAALSIRGMNERFPQLFQELKNAQDRSEVQFVNGTMNQSFPPYYTLESQIRQFDCGRAIFREALGDSPKVYASQEFGLTPQSPSILSQSGYANAVMRVQHLGSVPARCEKTVQWSSPGGYAIETLPSHPYRSEQLNATTYNNLHLKIYAEKESGCEHAVFTTFGDVSYYRPFREELARICHYSSVFGRFVTWSDFFAQGSEVESEVCTFNADDFEYAGFMNLPEWECHRTVMGHVNSHCVHAWRTSTLFSAVEMLQAMVGVHGERPGSAVERGWERLTAFQGHDNYLVPDHSCGGFLGGVTNQGAREAGRAMQTVVDYCGPWDAQTIREKSFRDLESAEGSVLSELHGLAETIAAREEIEGGYLVLSAGPANRRVVRFAGASGFGLSADGTELCCQCDGADLLALIDVPENGWLWVQTSSRATSASSSLSEGQNSLTLENEFLLAEFCADDGTLTRLRCKKDNVELVSPGAHRFHLPVATRQNLLSASRVRAGSVCQSIELEIELSTDDGARALIRSLVTLEAHSTMLDFEESIVSCPEICGDAWESHLSVGMRVSGLTQVQRAYFNVLETTNHRKFSSPNLLLASTPEACLVFFNAGNQFYTRDDNEIRNVLVFENEDERHFRYAIGCQVGNPIHAARCWSNFVAVHAVSSHVLAHPREERKDAASGEPFIYFDNDNVELLSCHLQGGRIKIRVASLTKESMVCRMTVRRPFATAYRTDFCGEERQPLQIEGSSVELSMRPWDIQQIEITPV